jgi:hypothetical protein
LGVEKVMVPHGGGTCGQSTCARSMPWKPRDGGCHRALRVRAVAPRDHFLSGPLTRAISTNATILCGSASTTCSTDRRGLIFQRRRHSDCMSLKRRLTLDVLARVTQIGRGRASNKEGESWTSIVGISSQSIHRSRAMPLRDRDSARGTKGSAVSNPRIRV